VDHRQPRGSYRGRRRVPVTPRNRYAAVMTTAFVGAGVVALVTGTVMPDTPEPDTSVALADASAAVQDAARAHPSSDRASRSDLRSKNVPAAATATAELPAPDLYFLPLHNYTVTSMFGERWGRPHKGIDLGAPKNTPYHAIADGKVILARAYGGYGNCIMIQHGDGIVSVYGHSNKILVKEGDTVQAGQVIGLVGDTGYSFGDHLHLEIRVHDQATDPIPFLKGKGADVPGKTDALSQ
jgi:murein DD-endopeptidase MepM/ murein hydrolase activator NlpD